jgi:NAD(P)-dependent dehydrogenase (short-subunit alcohol dehydrogenase family)
MGSKDQRVALITGANRGIGLETAKQLGRRGFHVVVGSRDERSARQAVDAIVQVGGTAQFLALDVSDSASIRSAAAEFASFADHLDVLVNNAGVYPDEDLEILTIPRAND